MNQKEKELQISKIIELIELQQLQLNVSILELKELFNIKVIDSIEDREVLEETKNYNYGNNKFTKVIK